VCIAFVLAVATSARADDDPTPGAFKITWEIPAECGPRKLFEQELAAQISPATAALAEELSVHIQVRADARAGWTSATIRARARRPLHGRSV
jgi:hypothetical protein